MIKSKKSQKDAMMMSGSTLAYIGDVVYELLVREYLINKYDKNAGALHKLSSNIVCADAQCKAFDLIENLLSEDEKNIFTRGRNSNLQQKKRSDPQKHCKATGFEALIGFLYLTDEERLLDLFELIIKSSD